MMHVKWWSGTHLNIVTTAKKVQTNLSETSSIVPHGCSCMKVFLGDDSIFEDTLYDYLMLSGQKIVKMFAILLKNKTFNSNTYANYIIHSANYITNCIIHNANYIIHNANYIMP